MENDKLNQEIQKKIFEIRMFEEQISQMEEKMRIIDKEILEFHNLISDLDEIKKISNKEVIVPLGKDIFIKSKIEKGDELFVNLGSRAMAKKNVEQAKKLLESRKDKFLEARENLGKEADKVIRRISEIDHEIMHAQGLCNH